MKPATNKLYPLKIKIYKKIQTDRAGNLNNLLPSKTKSTLLEDYYDGNIYYL